MKTSIQGNYTTKEEKVKDLFRYLYGWLAGDKGFDRQTALDILADYTLRLKGEEPDGTEVIRHYSGIIEDACRRTVEGNEEQYAEGFERIFFANEFGGLI